MQTFLPYAEFQQSASVLDWKRLGKQRVEAKQILNAISNSNGWRNHPAVKMWIGFEEALKHYHNTVICEWKNRGYRNNMTLFEIDYSQYKSPFWLGNEKFHASHRSNLLRKDANYYSQFNWSEPSTLPYVWPVK